MSLVFFLFCFVFSSLAACCGREELDFASVEHICRAGVFKSSHHAKFTLKAGKALSCFARRRKPSIFFVCGAANRGLNMLRSFVDDEALNWVPGITNEPAGISVQYLAF